MIFSYPPLPCQAKFYFVRILKGLKKIVVELERADLKSVCVAAIMWARSTHNHPRARVDCIKVVARWSCQANGTIFDFFQHLKKCIVFYGWAGELESFCLLER